MISTSWYPLARIYHLPSDLWRPLCLEETVDLQRACFHNTADRWLHVRGVFMLSLTWKSPSQSRILIRFPYCRY